MDRTQLLLRYCPWMVEATRLLGQAEIPGPQTAPFILNWLKRLHAPFMDDETPWCGTAAAGCLEAAGLSHPNLYYRARAWVGFGRAIANGKAEVTRLRRQLPYGALMVLDRPPRPSDGHVGFYAGLAERSDGPAVSLLAGNQGNKMSFATFPLDRVLYVGWPETFPVPNTIRRVLVAMATGLTVPPPASPGEA